jgi:nucleotide-binding universal stress UspA family protein
MNPDTTPPQSDTSTTGSWYPPAGQAPSGPILVATDGTPAGETAFRAASVVAARSSAGVRVIVVVEPLPVLVPEPSILAQPLVAPPELLDAMRDRVVAQMRALAPQGLDWRVGLEYGRPSAEIAHKAGDQKAQLIVIGLVHHGVVDRILDGDTALEVVRQCHAPVLLAAPNWKTLPMRGVFAVDFSTESMHAARTGLRILGDGATVILVHVRPKVTVFDETGMWEEEYEAAATKELGKFAAALGAPTGMRIEQVLLSGSPSEAVLRHADKTDADLIVAGTHGAGVMQRLLVGSVATRLMHHSTRSLLIVPRTED